MDSTAAQPHPLWSIADMVCEVMGHLHDRHTLAQCARVSRGLSDPALQVLWKEIKGLHALFSLIPTSIKQICVPRTHMDTFGRAVKDTHPIFISSESFQVEEWARLQYYAKLVHIYDDAAEDVDELATVALLQKLQGHALLPCLRQLTWERPSYQSSLLAVFLAPTLRNVKFHLLSEFFEGFYRHFDALDVPKAPEYANGAALRTLHARSPSLEHLTLFTNVFPCSIHPLRRFSNLRSLTLEQVINLALTLDVCSSFPLLQKLQLHSIWFDIRPPHPLPQATLLPHLEQLGVHGCLHGSLALLSAIHAPVLKSIGLDYSCRHHAQWIGCVEVLASRLGTSLTSLRVMVHAHNHISTESEPCFSFHDWFSPLYAFTNLRNVSVHKWRFYVDELFTIGADDIENMASAWPHLRVLDMLQVFDHLFPGFLITALATLLQKCPHLALLCLPKPHHLPLLETVNAVVPARKSSADIYVDDAEMWPPEAREKCLSYLQGLVVGPDLIHFGQRYLRVRTMRP